MKSILIALVTALTASTFAAPPSESAFETIKRAEAALKDSQAYIELEIAKEVLFIEQLEKDAELIREYANGNQSLLDLIVNYPVPANAGAALALAGASYASGRYLVPAMVIKQNAGRIAKMIQQFPKTAKAAPWIITAAATTGFVIYTVDRVQFFTSLAKKSPVEVAELYFEKINSLHIHHDNLARLKNGLLLLQADLNTMTEGRAKEILGEKK